MKDYLICFSNQYPSFWWPEFEAVADLFDIPFVKTDKPEKDEPYVVVKLNCDEDLRKILTRCALIKNGFELWGSGKSYEELYANLRIAFHDFKEHLADDLSWCIRVEGFGKKLTKPYILNKIEDFDFIPFGGPVNLQSPDITFYVLEYWGNDPNDVPQDPLAVYFGRLIGKGQGRLADDYSLKKRCYIGNTSMDARLSFVMANMAMVKPNDLVLDPFVGTGSILISAAHFGAYVVGCDIGYDVVHAQGKSSRKDVKYRAQDESIRKNFEQYGLENRFLDAFICDTSNHDLWHTHGIFDAIVTDPPYGLREKTCRIGTTKLDPTVPKEMLDRHYPMKTKYHISDVYLDLLDFASKYLRIGGRLVYWYPVHYDDFSDQSLPNHRSLHHVCASEQKLQQSRGRLLVVMQKHSEPQESDSAYIVNDMFADESFRDKVVARRRNRRAVE